MVQARVNALVPEHLVHDPLAFKKNKTAKLRMLVDVLRHTLVNPPDHGPLSMNADGTWAEEIDYVSDIPAKGRKVIIFTTYVERLTTLKAVS
jgi:hypothetical protein